MLLELVTSFEDLRMHLFHCIAEFHTEATEDISLPGVVFGVHPGLHLLVVDHASTERSLCLGSVECRTSLLDFSQQLLPVSKGVAQSVEDVFRFKVPQRLELQPFRHIIL